MENLIETIRAATTTEATDAERAAAAQACRTLLAALEAKAGEPLAAPQPAVEPQSLAMQAPVSAPPQAAAMHMIASALRGMQPDQLLDLAIARLRAAVPAGADVASVPGVKFHLLPLPPIGGRS